jgi:hypothetical protein
MVFGLLHYGAASAITLEVVPSSSTVNMGGSVTADIKVSGLGDGTAPSLGAYDIDLTFDASLFTFSSVSFGDPLLGNQLDPIFGFTFASDFFLVGHTLSLSDVSIEDPFILDAFQAPAFILASVVFDVNQTTGVGVFSLLVNDLSDSFGGLLDSTTIAATVQVVPVPAAILLFGTGLIGLIGFSKRRVGVSA